MTTPSPQSQNKQDNAITALFAAIWADYVAITPSAQAIRAVIAQADNSQPDELINDHIALRTFALPGMGIDDIAHPFVELGYVKAGEYDFTAKKLNAVHYQHPNTEHPKVFISELQVDQLSPQAQQIIATCTCNLPTDCAKASGFVYSGRHWDISHANYKRLLEESEYAAWLSVWGFRANHFTVSLNHLNSIGNIDALNHIVKAAGFSLNTSGGEIKGGANVLLAQSATLADKVIVQFSDAVDNIPSCFYEFAQRYPTANGELYHGFVAASADKIFESTNNK